jgi:AcrR family transcriptional regulator
VATESLLLSSARTLFATRGYHATSIRDVTNQAGIAVGAFYTHFKSKRDLLVALMQEMVDRIALIDLRPPAAMIRQLAVRAHFQELFRNDDHAFAVVRAWQEAVLTDSSLSSLDADILRWTERNIRTLLQHLLGCPNTRGDRDVEGVATVIATSVWTLLARSSAMPQEEFDRQIGTISDMLYHYVFRDRITSRAAEGACTERDCHCKSA